MAKPVRPLRVDLRRSSLAVQRTELIGSFVPNDFIGKPIQGHQVMYPDSRRIEDPNVVLQELLAKGHRVRLYFTNVDGRRSTVFICAAPRVLTDEALAPARLKAFTTKWSVK